MTTGRFISTGAALGALIAATPALAQADTGPEMTYEDRGYEYAQPAQQYPVQPRQMPVQQAVPQQAPIVYRHDPVVQPIPARQEYAAPVRYIKDRQETEYVYEEAPRQHAPAPHHYRQAPHAARQVAQPQYTQHHARQPHFDRQAWLSECVDRMEGRTGRRDRNGNVIGGLVGAAAGGLIGNRVAGRGDRLAGSLIGAGVGGLAGLAIGAAIDGASDDDRDDAYNYCENYLSHYSHGGNYGYQHGYAYQYAQPVMLVPVWVQVPQHAVVREYVTEETVEVEVVTYEEVPARRRVIERAPAPQPGKRIRYIKN